MKLELNQLGFLDPTNSATKDKIRNNFSVTCKSQVFLKSRVDKRKTKNLMLT